MVRTDKGSRSGRGTALGDERLRPLLVACGAGDEQALADLFDVAATGCLAVARCVTHDQAVAEEATHDAFLEVWARCRAGVAPRADIATWILALAHRHAHCAVDGRAQRAQPLPVSA